MRWGELCRSELICGKLRHGGCVAVCLGRMRYGWVSYGKFWRLCYGKSCLGLAFCVWAGSGGLVPAGSVALSSVEDGQFC